MSEYFLSPDQGPTHTIFPGVVIRTAWLDRVMTSVVEFEPHSIVERHSHPHEQMGIMIQGRAEFTIDGETRVLGPGDRYRIPSNVAHRVVALEQAVIAFDVFSPPREDYQ